jgi:hypothetical protein
MRLLRCSLAAAGYAGKLRRGAAPAGPAGELRLGPSLSRGPHSRIQVRTDESMLGADESTTESRLGCAGELRSAGPPARVGQSGGELRCAGLPSPAARGCHCRLCG